MENTLDNMLDKFIDTLDELSKYSFEYGILSQDGVKTVKVNVLNPDETISAIDMKVADIMYFVENGTITLPAKHILQKSIYYLNDIINQRMSEILQEIITNNIESNQIENRLKQLEQEIEIRLKNFFKDSISSYNQLEHIIDKDTDTKELFNLNELSKYIKCKLVKN